MFLINSRLGRFTATPEGSGRAALHPRWHSFSRSCGVIMPSSLTMVLPIASVYSTRPPVSVLVRARAALLRGFSREHGITDFTHSLRLASRGRASADFHAEAPYLLSRGRPEPRSAALLRHPIVQTLRSRYRNIRLLCIGYACLPRLSSRLTLGGLALPRNP